MGRVRRSIGRGFLGMHRFGGRVRAKSFSVFAGGAFAAFGKRSVMQPPVRLSGERRIQIGNDVFLGAGGWLQTLDGTGTGVALRIGDGTRAAGGCVISAAESVTIGRKVLMARNCHVSDHMHAYDDPDVAILDQGITRVAPVVIGDGAWLGENVVIYPGVNVGAGAVIAANSVVLDDVPARAVAHGAPARVVRRLSAPPARGPRRTRPTPVASA